MALGFRVKAACPPYRSRHHRLLRYTSGYVCRPSRCGAWVVEERLDSSVNWLQNDNSRCFGWQARDFLRPQPPTLTVVAEVARNFSITPGNRTWRHMGAHGNPAERSQAFSAERWPCLLLSLRQTRLRQAQRYCPPPHVAGSIRTNGVAFPDSQADPSQSPKNSLPTSDTSSSSWRTCPDNADQRRSG